MADHDEAVAAMSATAEPGDVLLTLGARDPELPVTAKRLASPAG
jgi:hypothetical protein